MFDVRTRLETPISIKRLALRNLPACLSSNKNVWLLDRLARFTTLALQYKANQTSYGKRCMLIIVPIKYAQ
ncbi:unnamed protein product [Heterobilharzia americana]|nr:unnamed protein product [Heterobilharzia americana]